MHGMYALIIVAGFFLALPLSLAAAKGRAPGGLVDRALMKNAAQGMDAIFGYLAASVEALGREYAGLEQAADPGAQGRSQKLQAEKKRMLAERMVKGQTAIYKTWPGELDPPPEQGAKVPSFLSYAGADLSDETVRQFNIFSALTPAFRSAHDTFGLSWVYLTTENDAMLVYPFLPLSQAQDSHPPRSQVFYTCADFKGRAPGWSRPYQDLAGAGMMITVSAPVYKGDKLLGVASRDITIKQLAQRFLANLAAYPESIALIMDDRGLAIASSDNALTVELERVNTAAGHAALFLRTQAGLKNLGPDRAQSSSNERVNKVCEEVLARAGGDPGGGRFTLGADTVLAARMKTTGWFLVLVNPH